MQSAKYFLLSLQARLAGAMFGVVSGLSMIAAVVVMFASTSGELEPALAALQLWSPSSHAVTQLANLKPASPASEAMGAQPGKAGSG